MFGGYDVRTSQPYLPFILGQITSRDVVALFDYLNKRNRFKN